MIIRNTENGKIIELGAVDSHGIDFLQDFFEGGRIFNGVYNDDDDCYDTDSDGFDRAIFAFENYITLDKNDNLEEKWLAAEKCCEEKDALDCFYYGISLDNGNNYRTVDELTDDEVSFLLKDEIPDMQEAENGAWSKKYQSVENCPFRFSADNATGDTDREWLKSFVKYLRDHYGINIVVG